MWSYGMNRLFIVSSQLSTLFSFLILLLTIFHHITVQRELQYLLERAVLISLNADNKESLTDLEKANG